MKIEDLDEEPWATDPDAWKGGEGENPLGLPDGAALKAAKAFFVFWHERRGSIVSIFYVGGTREMRNDYRTDALGEGIHELVDAMVGEFAGPGTSALRERWKILS